MKARQECTGRASARGFSLVEFVVVIFIISIVCAAIFSQIEVAQQRAVAEQGRVDDFQQARDFLGQIFRDTRQIGFPNVRNFDVSIGTWQSPLINDHRLAAGLIQLRGSQLQCEGDVDGSGNVWVVSYKINGNGSCATCLQRAQVLKVDGNPLTGQSNLTNSAYSVEVENVQNTTAIFSAYDSSGNSITLPIDITNNASTVASAKVIQVNLTIASPNSVDPRTRQRLEADIAGRVQILNCSMATTGGSFTCQ